MRAVFAVAMFLMLAGCLTEPDDTPRHDSGIPSGGTTGEDGITISTQGDTYYASRTVDRQGGYLSGADITLTTGNGWINLDAQAKTGYTLKVLLAGWGDSEQQARDRLNAIALDIGDSGGLSVHATTPRNTWNNQKATIDVSVATSNVGDIHMDTGNGDLDVRGLEADRVNLDTGNGDIYGDIDASDVILDSGNGNIDWTGDVRGFTADTGNNDIDVVLRPLATADWRLDTGNGEIDLTIVEDSRRGYDISGRTGNGDIRFNFDEMETLSESDGPGPASKRVQTLGFATRSIQVTAELDTGNGDINGQS